MAFDSQDIGYGGDILQPLMVVVDYSYVVGLLTEHLGQMRADLTGSLYDDFHILFLM